MRLLDGFSKVGNPNELELTQANKKVLESTYLDKRFMTLVTTLGLGTQLLLICIFAVLNQLILYFWLIVTLGNAIWLTLTIWTHVKSRNVL